MLNDRIKAARERRSKRIEEILESRRYAKAQRIVHHKKTSVAAHSLRTAEYGSRISRWLNRHGIEVNEEDVVEACLLHDIGMTDDEVSSSASWKKAYRHPKKSEQIAREEYHANENQCNAIRRHMWPICIIPPKSIEGWVVVAADKCGSFDDLIEGAHEATEGEGTE